MPDRPRVYKTEGIVLRRRNVGEADSILTIYSPRLGKFDAVARGVRKARSHMRGHLEPLTHSRLMLARGRSLDVLTQAETVEPYRATREDLERSAAALYCLELVDQFVEDHEAQEGLWNALLATLALIETDVASAQAQRHFELQLLALSGYELQLDRCSLCGGRLPESETLLAPSAGGLVCGPCRPTTTGGRIVSVRAVKVLRYAGRSTIDEFAALQLGPELQLELESALALVIRHILEREPFTPRYLAEVRRLPAADVPRGS